MIGIVTGAIGLVLGVGAVLFKLVARLVGLTADSENGWALPMSTVQLALALCLIVAGVILVLLSRRIQTVPPVLPK